MVVSYLGSARFRLVCPLLETPFAVLKACFDLRRFLLRGHQGVQTEFQWACTAFNLKKMMTLLAGLRAGSQDSTEILECCGT